MAGDAMTPAHAFSILVPSFNGDPYIDEALDSALSQMNEADELIVQDGGSKDGSIERLRLKYADEPRVTIFSEPDEGQSDALEKALARARNSFVGWLNADDVYYPGALDIVRATLEANPSADVIYGGSRIFDNNGRVLRQSSPAEFTVRSFVRHGCHVFSGATFFRRSKLVESGGFDKSLHYSMDFDLYFRLAEHGAEAVKVPDVLGGLRWHEASKSGSASMKFVPEAARIRLARAEGFRDRVHIYRQIGFRVAMVPLTPLRHSRTISKLRGTKTFG